MAFLSYGMRRGLAVKNDWASDQNFALRNEALNRQAQATQEAKMKLMGDEFKFATAENDWDRARLKEFNTEKTKEIGKFAVENPNYRSDLGLQLQYKKMLRELTDNDIAVRALRVDTSYKELQKYMKDNPEDLDDPQSELNRMLAEYTNYKKTGSIDGNTANAKEFMFQKPTEYDPVTDAMNIAKLMKADTRMWRQGEFFGLENKYRQDQIDANVTMYYAKNAKKLEKKFDALPDPLKSFYGTSYSWFEKTLKSALPEGPTSISQYHVPTVSGGHSGRSGSSSDSLMGRWQAYKTAIDLGKAPPNKANIALVHKTGTGTPNDPYCLKVEDGGQYRIYVPGKSGELNNIAFTSKDKIIISDASDIKYQQVKQANGSYVSKPAYVKVKVSVPVSLIDPKSEGNLELKKQVGQAYGENELPGMTSYNQVYKRMQDGKSVQSVQKRVSFEAYVPYYDQRDGGEWADKYREQSTEGSAKLDVENIIIEAQDRPVDVGTKIATTEAFKEKLLEKYTENQIAEFSKAQLVALAKKVGITLFDE